MNLKKIIQDTSKEEWEHMKDACIERAGKFSLSAFANNLKKYLYEA